MIPILYEGSETSFSNNGLGRLYDCTSCIVSEERNGIYECDFEMPVDGAHFNDVKLGRIIAVKHDYSDDIQPFDIVSYSKPIDGKVTFHAVHVSYRLSQIVTWGTSINSLANAFSNFTNTAVPSNNFTFSTDKTSTGLVSAFDGIPKSVKSILGGTEGSLLDAYGGEYKWDRFNVALYESRGLQRNLVVRYGINMTDYTDDTDISEVYTHAVAYWKGQDGDNEVIVKTSLVNSGLVGLDDRTRAEAIDLSDKFESKPTTSQLQTEAINYMTSNQTNLPKQTINVSFINLRDTSEYAEFSSLFECGLCDTIKVVFPKYGMMGMYKIVKTVYDVLLERYQEMELGSLSITLSEALGLTKTKG